MLRKTSLLLPIFLLVRLVTAQPDVVSLGGDSVYNQLYEWHEGRVILKNGVEIRKEINFNFLADALTTHEFYKTGGGQYFAPEVDRFYIQDPASGHQYRFVSAVGEITKKETGATFYNVLHEGAHYVLLSKYVVRWELEDNNRFIVHGVRWNLYLMGPNGLLRYSSVNHKDGAALKWHPDVLDHVLAQDETQRLRKVDMKAVWQLDPRYYRNLQTYAKNQGLEWDRLEDLAQILDHLDKMKSRSSSLNSVNTGRE